MYNTLIDYFQSAIAWSFWLALLSCVGLLTDLETKQDWKPIAFSFWIFFLMTSGFSCYRLIQLFSRILRSI
jgi:hypothetical protein